RQQTCGHVPSNCLKVPAGMVRPVPQPSSAGLGARLPRKKWLPHAALTRYFENCCSSIRIVRSVIGKICDEELQYWLHRKSEEAWARTFASLYLSFGEHAAERAFHFLAILGRVIPVNRSLQAIAKRHFRLPPEQFFGQGIVRDAIERARRHVGPQLDFRFVAGEI